MALADRFVCGRDEFKIVALAPFITISLMLLCLTYFVPLYWKFATLGAATMHSLFCGGDFGLLSYFEFHKDKEIVTYDDVATKMSFFYEKVNS